MRRTSLSLCVVALVPMFIVGGASAVEPYDASIARASTQSAGFDPGAFFSGGPKPTPNGAKPKPTGSVKTIGRRDKVPRAVPNRFTGQQCRGSRVRRSCAHYSRGRLVRQCTLRGRTSTCTYYNAKAKPYKVCTKKPGARAKCRRVGGGNAFWNPRFSAIGKQSAAWEQGKPITRLPQGLNDLIAQGFTNPLMGAVGALWADGRQVCSGTLIARGVVLTAAHCIYENGASSNTPSGYFQGVLEFNPGQTWFEGYELRNPVYGTWSAKSWWVTQGWADNDPGVDWGLIELYPDANGNYPGDTVGNFVARANIPYSAGTHAYLVGYPREGIFSTIDFHTGLGQYFCGVTWNEATIPSGGARSGSNVFLAYNCSMTGGSSGGPIFVELSDGSWVVGGVNNQADLCDGCVRGTATPYYANWVETAYFDDRIVQFWNSIFG